MSIYNYHVLKGLDLSEARVLDLLPAVEVKMFEAGDPIYGAELHQPPWCHVVDGMINVCVAGTGDSPRPITVSIYGAGTWFGELSFITRQASSNQFIALTRSRLLSVPFADASKAFEEDSNFSRHLARLVAWRAQQNAEMLALMKAGNPPRRVVLGLAVFAESLSSGNSHLSSLDADDLVKIPVKQEVLASMCGVSRGVFSECIQRLATAGLVELSYAALTLQNGRAWRLYAAAHRRSHWGHSNDSIKELIEQVTTFVAADKASARWQAT